MREKRPGGGGRERADTDITKHFLVEKKGAMNGNQSQMYASRISLTFHLPSAFCCVFGTPDVMQSRCANDNEFSFR